MCSQCNTVKGYIDDPERTGVCKVNCNALISGCSECRLEIVKLQDFTTKEVAVCATCKSPNILKDNKCAAPTVCAASKVYNPISDICEDCIPNCEGCIH